MSLEARELHRRHNLKQQQTPSYMMGHHHGQWFDQFIPIHLGDTRVNSVPGVRVGQTIPINPVAFQYSVKAVLLVTYSFTGAPHTATLTLSDCSGTTTTDITSVASYTLLEWDVSDWFGVALKELCSVGVRFYVNVDNTLATFTAHGVTLLVTHYKNDTFGGFENPVDSLLALPGNTDKDYLNEQKKLSENFEYLSGLRKE